MSNNLAGRKVAIIGGDRRELVLMVALVRMGAEVLVAGYDTLPQLPERLTHRSMRESLAGADAVILPMSGTDEEGKIKAVFSTVPLVLEPADFDLIKPNTPVLVGVVNPYLKLQSERHNLRLIETAELDEVAIFNSIPTAEGAIEIAMRETSITLHGSQLLIFGFGRIGMTLARMLKGIGAQVSVVARKPADLARAKEQGYKALDYNLSFTVLEDADVVFNTVPQLIIGDKHLSALRPETLIIDLASAPGGVDFEAASYLGLKTIQALGLPGRVAPQTAGRILGQVYPNLLLEQWEQGVSQ